MNDDYKLISLENEIKRLQKDNTELKKQIDLLTGVLVEQFGDYFL